MFQKVFFNINSSAGATYVKKMYNFLYHFEPLYKFTKSYQMEKKHVFDYVFKFGEEIFNEKKHLLNKNSKQQLNDEEIGTRKSKNFINTLIDPNNGYDEAEMTQEINTFMIAVNYKDFEWQLLIRFHIISGFRNFSFSFFELFVDDRHAP